MEKRCRSDEYDSNFELAPALFQCANLILPWLRPADIASISSTCKALNRLSRAITGVRSSDASRGFEKFPIPFENAFDGQAYSYFVYTPCQTLSVPHMSSFRQPWGMYPEIRPRFDSDLPDPFSVQVENAGVCECEKCDGDSNCPCCSSMEFGELTRECGRSCRCGAECGNRVTQRGVLVRLKIVRDRKKGWSLYADQFIPEGQFVCEYAGELLTIKEARIRQHLYDELKSNGHFSSALLVLREHLPSGNACMRLNIDATRIGNIARFINHCCDGGNLSTVLVRCSGAVLPRLCFFASRHIHENEELTFCYGDIRVKAEGPQCFCGSSCCSGILLSRINRCKIPSTCHLCLES